MKETLKILFVEDVLTDAELNWREIEKSGIVFDKLLVDTRRDYIEGLETYKPDVIISDYALPQFDGMSALLLRNELAPLIPFILVTGSINEEVAVECMRAGADDYILKNRLSRLGPAILNSVAKSRLLKEKKTSEEELIKSELRLEKAQSIAHVGNWELDLSTRKMWGSKEALQIYGIESSTNEISLEAAQKIVLPEYRPILDEALDRLLKYNEPYQAEFKIKRKNDGAIRWIYSKAEILLSQEGTKVNVIGVIQDITEPKMAAEELRKSQQIVEGILNAIPVRVFWKDKNLVYLGCNAVFARDSGFNDPKDVIGKDDYQMGWSDQAEAYRKDDLQVIESGIPKFHIEESQSTPEGKVITLLTSKLPLRGSNMEITGLLGSYIDITDRKEAQERLYQSLLFSESLLKTIPFGMDIVDEYGNVLFQSDNFIELFGEKKIGEKCWELYRDDKKQCPDCPLFKGITLGETEAYESHGVLGNRIFEINHTGMMYQGKKAMLEIFQDITDRKNSETELILAKNKAEESDKLKTAFLHNISHEIRTPMNAIVGFAALLGEPDIDAKESRDYIEVIMQSSNHLLEIITDIVDISNIEANLVKVAKNKFNVNSALLSLCKQFVNKADEKKVHLICETALSDNDALVLTDGTKVNQILINLLSNALKFTDKGQIKVIARLKDNFLEFCVSDTGIGIAQESQDRIFERFYQVQHSVSRLYEGTGLGLAISKAHVELLGGKIWVNSEPGKGASFFFTIPYEKQLAETPVEEEKINPGYFVFPEKKKILVAEDIDSNFKLICYFLSGANIEVIRAVNGREAVDKFSAIPDIDLILMDIKMPVMDGYKATKLIREKNASIPIIAQTAYADDHETAFEAGCSGFVSKPFDKKGLLEVIQRTIYSMNCP